eukprot:s450_g30.t1
MQKELGALELRRKRVAFNATCSLFFTGGCEPWAAVLREKFDLISSLLEVFSHETNQRWPMLDDEKVTKQFRVESEKAKSELLQDIVRLELYKQATTWRMI